MTSGKVYNEMMFRHWDEWRETYSHLFVADFDGGTGQPMLRPA